MFENPGNAAAEFDPVRDYNKAGEVLKGYRRAISALRAKAESHGVMFRKYSALEQKVYEVCDDTFGFFEKSIDATQNPDVKNGLVHLATSDQFLNQLLNSHDARKHGSLFVARLLAKAVNSACFSILNNTPEKAEEQRIVCDACYDIVQTLVPESDLEAVFQAEKEAVLGAICYGRALARRVEIFNNPKADEKVKQGHLYFAEEAISHLEKAVELGKSTAELSCMLDFCYKFLAAEKGITTSEGSSYFAKARAAGERYAELRRKAVNYLLTENMADVQCLSSGIFESIFKQAGQGYDEVIRKLEEVTKKKD
jgi:hypothetical protein